MAKLTILEGIPGSGKSTLLETMDGMKYYEGDLLLSWKHNLIPYITKTRIELFNHFLDRIEKHEGNVVLERFHLSLRLTDFRNDLTKTTYSKLIKRLSKLDTKTIIMTVPEKM